MIDFETHGKAAVLTINRPEARNAVNGAVAQGIEEGIDRLEADDDLWIGVLTHAGPVFSAGADLKVIGTDPGQMMTERGGFAGIVTRERTKPIIAAVNGPALAGGCEIALSCDLIVASTDSRFGIPEVKRCLVAAAGGLFRLPRVLPFNVALEMGLTGDPISAERAEHFGLVNRLAEPGKALDVAFELAESINTNAPLAVRETLKQMRELRNVTDDREGINASNAALGGLMSTEDFAEGPMAFIEKRDPVWKGR
jgi:enoyl-CoA hydratase